MKLAIRRFFQRDRIYWTAGAILSMLSIILLILLQKIGSIFSLKASLDPSAVLRRDFDLGLPASVQLPTQIATAVASEVVSVGQNVASAVTSALAQATAAPYLQISVNASDATFELGGLASHGYRQHSSSLSPIMWLTIAIQIADMIVLGYMTWREQAPARLLRRLVQVLSSFAMVLSLILLSIVTLLSSAAKDIGDNIKAAESRVYWKFGFSITTTLAVLAVAQFACTVLDVIPSHIENERGTELDLADRSLLRRDLLDT